MHVGVGCVGLTIDTASVPDPEVLADDPRSERNHQHRDQVGILAQGLLDASPAVVAHDVEHRSEPLVHADGAHVLADPPSHPLDEVGVERGARPVGAAVSGQVNVHRAGTDGIPRGARHAPHHRL